ncbi:histidine kinase [Nautilia profundicola AmH]|uniref:histidine kinase n=1 Tax=Nautilia profundicola (strain ATCC BAA-1463 / DSM 18972 / AmH) TaxID=598659 RepID=B9L856_NAUPA|nr:histidine kinase [Nautilia profundicola AmH]
MLAEKKSLRRFLLIYVISTLLLVGIGEWFYYKAKYHSEIDSQISQLSNELKLYLAENKGMLRSLRFSKNYNIGDNIKIAVYKDGTYMFGNFKPMNIKWNREFWINGKNIYYLYTMPKRWGKVDIIVTKSINEEKISELKKQLIIFNVFVVFIVIITAFILGKIFLKPLKSSIEMLEDFIRDATHEMNTPISVILTNIEMLKMKDIESKELQRIEFSAKRLEKIFKDLAFVRLNHKQKKEIISINIKDLIRKRIEIFQTLLENKKISFDKSCEDFYVNADREDMIRLIDNLLSNAIKYSPQNETIHLSLKNGIFCIANKGKIKNLEKITKKFYRENQNEGGFGLGLYIVKKICDYYGFEFNIKNENSFVKTFVKFK